MNDMDNMDIQFTCPDCDRRFPANTQDILEKETIACPDCGCTLTEEELEALKMAVNYLLDQKNSLN